MATGFCAIVETLCRGRTKPGAAPKEIAEKLQKVCLARSHVVYKEDQKRPRHELALISESTRDCVWWTGQARLQFGLNFAQEELSKACQSARRVCKFHGPLMTYLDRLHGQRSLP